MLFAGMRLMNESMRLAPSREVPHDIRVMVAGRGENAMTLLGTFVAGGEVVNALYTEAGEVIQ